MTRTTTVRSHSRRVPDKPADPFQPEISRRIAEIRAKANADKAVNELRQEIGYQTGTNMLLLIAGRLKVLALKAKELVQ